MKLKLLFFLPVFIVAIISCKTGNKNIPGYDRDTAPANISRHTEKPFANIVFASKNDTTCGMPISAGLEDTVRLNDKVYGFCSRECKDEFVSTLKAQHKR